MRIRLPEADETPLLDVPVAGFAAFNGPHVGPHGYKRLRLMVFRDGEETPAGGIQGHGYAAWLHGLMVFLPEDLRWQGLGTRPLPRIAAEARARGCIGAHLDAPSWQARPFHEKQDDRLFGTLPDGPPGQSRHAIMNRFDGENRDVPA